MSRKVLSSTIFVVSFFLVFLGMRNTYLCGESGPKQRPRAITEENSPKKSLEVVYSVELEDACLQAPAFTPPAQQTNTLKPIAVLNLFTFIEPTTLLARAPPAHFTQIA